MVDMRLWNNLLETVKNDSEIKRSDKKFPCPRDNCNKIYTTANHLSVHMRNHTGDRPYRCKAIGCGKAFATGYSLKAHIRTHTGEKPYGCQSCHKHFKTSGDLQKHVRTHTGEKPFKCPVESCGRSFTTSNIRKVHVRYVRVRGNYLLDRYRTQLAVSKLTKHHILVYRAVQQSRLQVTHWRKTLRLPVLRLRKGIRFRHQLQKSHADTFRGETISLSCRSK